MQTAKTILRRQDFASPGSAPVEHPASTLGSHACAESMRAFALDNAGLKGSFHSCDPGNVFKKKGEARQTRPAKKGGVVYVKPQVISISP